MKAFQTVVALAVYDATKNGGGKVPRITEKHLVQVVNMSAAFKTYIKSARQGLEPEDDAYNLGNRNDRHHEEERRRD